MATGGAFKTLGENDVVSTRTLLHEAIPITGTIVSGTYGEYLSEGNIKNHSHGMFQTVYDYPYLSSSANHIFDITVGVSPSSNAYSSVSTQQAKKRNIYNQLAQVLVGYDVTGSVLNFDADGNILAGGRKHTDVIVIPFSRLLVKDEIKKGSFTMKLGLNASYANAQNIGESQVTITDASGSDGYFVNSPAGEYGVLFAENSTYTADTSVLIQQEAAKKIPCGLLYYQAGIAVLTGSLFMGGTNTNIDNQSRGLLSASVQMNHAGNTFEHQLDNSNIQTISNLIRRRIHDITFNNTTELNSTIYFCRAHHSEFNYSTNPTYLTGSKIRVKTNASDTPVSYITTIGLYNDNNELMAVAKLSEPLKKTPDVEFTLRVRLDY